MVCISVFFLSMYTWSCNKIFMRTTIFISFYVPIMDVCVMHTAHTSLHRVETLQGLIVDGKKLHHPLLAEVRPILFGRLSKPGAEACCVACWMAWFYEHIPCVKILAASFLFASIWQHDPVWLYTCLLMILAFSIYSIKILWKLKSNEAIHMFVDQSWIFNGFCYLRRNCSGIIFDNHRLNPSARIML